MQKYLKLYEIIRPEKRIVRLPLIPRINQFTNHFNFQITRIYHEKFISIHCAAIYLTDTSNR